MNYFLIVASKMVTLVIFMSAGVAAVKTGILDRSGTKVLSSLLVNIAVPCLCFDLVYSQRVTIFSIAAIWRFALSYLLAIIALCFIGKLVAKFARVEEEREGAYRVSMMMGNSTFLGVPIMTAMFPGGEANLYVPVFAFMGQAVLWTLGVYLLGKSNKEMRSQSLVKRLSSPILAAIILAVVITSLDLYIPEHLESAIAALGNTCFSWALVYLGATLSFVDFRNMGKNLSMLLVVPVKMIIVPLSAYYLTATFLTYEERLILTLLLALPVMTSIPMAVEKYGGDSSYVAQIVFITTILCVFTVPLVFWIVG